MSGEAMQVGAAARVLRVAKGAVVHVSACAARVVCPPAPALLAVNLSGSGLAAAVGAVLSVCEPGACGFAAAVPGGGEVRVATTVLRGAASAEVSALAWATGPDDRRPTALGAIAAVAAVAAAVALSAACAFRHRSDRSPACDSASHPPAAVGHVRCV